MGAIEITHSQFVPGRGQIKCKSHKLTGNRLRAGRGEDEGSCETPPTNASRPDQGVVNPSVWAVREGFAVVSPLTEGRGDGVSGLRSLRPGPHAGACAQARQMARGGRSLPSKVLTRLEGQLRRPASSPREPPGSTCPRGASIHARQGRVARLCTGPPDLEGTDPHSQGSDLRRPGG